MLNFGSLKNHVTNKLIESYTGGDAVGKEMFKKFLKTLKEDKTLKTQFFVYKNLEDKKLSSEVSSLNYIKENINLFSDISKKDLKESNDKLFELIGSPDNLETSELHESIHNLITLKPSAENLDKIQDSTDIIKEWILTDNISLTENTNKEYVRDGVNPNNFLDVAVKKYNEKYSDLSEDAKLIIKVIREGNDTDKSETMKNMTKEIVSLINEKLKEHTSNIDIKEKLLETKDAIYNMEYNSDSFAEDIQKLVQLKTDLS